MNFPSLKNLLQSAQYVIRRFPFEMLFAFLGTIAAIINFELEYRNMPAQSWCMRAIMTANLGLLVSLSVTLFLESKSINGSKSILYKLIAAIAAALLIFTIDPVNYSSDYIRFLLLSLSFHLLVAFAGFIKPGYIQGFWQFNKTLFLRFLTGGLYSAVLYLGLAAAIGAVKFLFSISIPSNLYADLWVCIVGLFNTLFFLAGVPSDLVSIEKDTSYPKGLKIFTQYVLIPLATVYQVILLAYEFKILVEWRLPKGLVSNLILGYAVFGILSLLLVFPIREETENKWIKTYSRSFYVAMLPLIVLLFLAIGARIFTYGITEFRYFLILLACWLLFITIYFLFSKKQNIKVIPVSLFVITLLSIYGPQSAFSVAMRAQRGILIRIMERNNGLKNGKLQKITRISKKDGERAVATLEYLTEHYELDIFQPYIAKDMKLLNDSLNRKTDKKSSSAMGRYELRTAKMKWFTAYLGLKNFSGRSYDYNDYDQRSYFYVHAIQSRVSSVKGYDLIVDQDGMSVNNKAYSVDGIRIQTNVRDKGTLVIRLNQDSTEFNLRTLMTTILKNEPQVKSYEQETSSQNQTEYSLPPGKLSFSSETRDFRVNFVIKTARFYQQNNSIGEITYIDGFYLISKK